MKKKTPKPPFDPINKLTAKSITETYNRLKKTKRPAKTARLLEIVALSLLEGIQDGKNN